MHYKCIIILWVAIVLVPGYLQATEELSFLTWAEYMDPSVVTEFENSHQVKVKFIYYESDDARNEMLAASNGRGYDLVLVSGLMLQGYSKREWLTPLPVESIPNLSHIEPRWRTAFPASERYAVPYFWGTLGIAYRKDHVPEGFPSWRDFFQPSDKLRDKIAVLRSSRDVVGMALKALGYSVNTNDGNAIREAGNLLQIQRPYVRAYEYLVLNAESSLVSGDIWAALAYSGDTLMVQQHHDAITYTVPKEGSNLWVDYLAILQASPRKALAAQFIDFLNRPDIAARNAEFVFYATPNSEASQHVSDDYLNNPVIYPPEDVIARSEAYRELSPRAQKTLNSIFVQIVQ